MQRQQPVNKDDGIVRSKIKNYWSMKTNKHLTICFPGFASIALDITGCDENRNKATLGETQDVSRVNNTG
jgi:hypothetical protein